MPFMGENSVNIVNGKGQMPYLLLFYPVFATEKGGVDETIGQFGTVLDVNTGDVFC